MINWHKVKEKVWEFGGKILGGVAESFGLSIGKKGFGIAPHGGGSHHDSAIANLTFPVKYILQGASPEKGRVTLTNRAKGLGYQ